jgi:hypothetical protein
MEIIAPAAHNPTWITAVSQSIAVIGIVLIISNVWSGYSKTGEKMSKMA